MRETCELVARRAYLPVVYCFEGKPMSRGMSMTGAARGTLDRCGSKETLRRRSALAITETDERLIAALASIGLRRRPKNG